MRKSRRIISVLFLCIVNLVLLAGCASGATNPTTSAITTNSTTPAGTTSSTVSNTLSGTPSSSPPKTTVSSDVYSIAIIFNGNQVAALTKDDLLKLDQISVTANGTAQNGPTLLSALKAGGINDFSELTAYGFSKGRIATAELTLKKDQIDDTVVLDINNRGKCKLCGVNIPQDNWIIDIEKVEVK